MRITTGTILEFHATVATDIVDKNIASIVVNIRCTDVFLICRKYTDRGASRIFARLSKTSELKVLWKLFSLREGKLQLLLIKIH